MNIREFIWKNRNEITNRWREKLASTLPATDLRSGSTEHAESRIQELTDSVLGAILDARADETRRQDATEQEVFVKAPGSTLSPLTYAHILSEFNDAVIETAERKKKNVDEHASACTEVLEEVFDTYTRSVHRDRVPYHFEPGRDSPFHEKSVQSERLAVIGQLAAGVAHEIGNPLTSISSIVQILRRKTTDPFFTEQLNHIKVSIDRIARIVHELVDFSRPSPFNPLPSNLNEIIMTAVGMMKYDRRVKHIDISTELGTGIPSLMLAPDQILQVIINLIMNAVDAMKGVGRIVIKTWGHDTDVHVSITDTGCGIPKIILPRIFDPFFTTKKVGEGTGLGLSVSYGIVGKHSGRIEVESIVGEGSTFTVILPLPQSK